VSGVRDPPPLPFKIKSLANSRGLFMRAADAFAARQERPQSAHHPRYHHAGGAPRLGENWSSRLLSTNERSIVGTALDYLFRFEIQRRCPGTTDHGSPRALCYVRYNAVLVWPTAAFAEHPAFVETCDRFMKRARSRYAFGGYAR
jgi:hypothetical protein